MSKTKFLKNVKPKFTRAEFHFDIGVKDFSIHWERTMGEQHYYLANVFRGGGYRVSYPVNCSPNQSNSANILDQFLKECPQDDITI